MKNTLSSLLVCMSSWLLAGSLWAGDLNVDNFVPNAESCKSSITDTVLVNPREFVHLALRCIAGGYRHSYMGYGAVVEDIKSNPQSWNIFLALNKVEIFYPPFSLLCIFDDNVDARDRVAIVVGMIRDGFCLSCEIIRTHIREIPSSRYRGMEVSSPLAELLLDSMVGGYEKADLEHFIHTHNLSGGLNVDDEYSRMAGQFQELKRAYPTDFMTGKTLVGDDWLQLTTTCPWKEHLRNIAAVCCCYASMWGDIIFQAVP